MILAASTLQGTNCNETVPQNITLPVNNSGDISTRGKSKMSIVFG